MNKARLKEKDWLKIVTFSVPIIAVVVGNALNMDSTKELEDAIMLVLSAVLGLIGVIGVAKNNDKKKSHDEPLEAEPPLVDAPLEEPTPTENVNGSELPSDQPKQE